LIVPYYLLELGGCFALTAQRDFGIRRHRRKPFSTLRSLRRIAAEIILLNRGRVIESANAAQFFNAPTTREASGFIAGELLDMPIPLGAVMSAKAASPVFGA
jgi:hypothetical protein